MCLNIGTPRNHCFPFGTNGKVVVLGVPILKHIRVPPEIIHIGQILVLNIALEKSKSDISLQSYQSFHHLSLYLAEFCVENETLK